MKTTLIITFCIAFLSSCMKKNDLEEEFLPITFEKTFPKKNKLLSEILGTNLILKRNADTINLKISSNKKYNLITNSQTGDTIFQGTVCKFRGLYYFSEQYRDSLYLIYAIKIENNLIFGLNDLFLQLLEIKDRIRNGEHPKLVKFINSDSTDIRLFTNKRDLRKLFEPIIENIIPDTILNFNKTPLSDQRNTTIINTFEPEDYNYILSVYPNPTVDIITVKTQQIGKNSYELTNLKGTIVLSGQLDEIENKLNLSNQSSGIYFLSVINDTEKKRETIKIVKKE